MKKHILVIDKCTVCHRRIKNKYDCSLTLIVDVTKIKQSDRQIYDRIMGLNSSDGDIVIYNMAIAINEIEKIDEILCLNEKYQELTSEIAETVGVDCNCADTYRAVNNKYYMRKLLSEKKLTNVSYKLVRCKDDVRDFFQFVNKPILVKPCSGVGSKDIIKISCEKELDSIQEKLEDEMIAETYINGHEYSVEAITYRGKSKVLCITQKYKDETNYVERGHLVPAILSEDDICRVSRYVEQVLEAINVNTGVTHTEVMINDNYVEIIETHIRIGGDYIPEIIEAASGFNLIDIQASLTFNDPFECQELFKIEPLTQKNRKCYGMVYFQFIHKNGVIKEIKNAPIKENDNEIIEIRCNAVGDYVEKTRDSFTRGAMLIVSGDEYEKCIKKCEDYVNRIEYIIT